MSRVLELTDDEWDDLAAVARYVLNTMRLSEQRAQPQVWAMADRIHSDHQADGFAASLVDADER